MFFFYCYGTHRDLHSFPTRRSSDLDRRRHGRRGARRRGRRRPRRRHGEGQEVQPFVPLEPSVRPGQPLRSEEHTSELQSQSNLVCRLLLEKKKKKQENRRNDIEEVE